MWDGTKIQMKNLFASSFDDKLKIEQKPTPAAPTVVASPLPPPTPFTPCPTCNSSHFWFDRFGAGPRCSTCHPWPSRSLVAYRTIGGQRVSEHGESPVDATVDATGAFPGRSAADLDREFSRNWTTTEHGPCMIWPNGYTAVERNGVYEQRHRFAMEALRQQERQKIKAENAMKTEENGENVSVVKVITPEKVVNVVKVTTLHATQCVEPSPTAEFAAMVDAL